MAHLRGHVRAQGLAGAEVDTMAQLLGERVLWPMARSPQVRLTSVSHPGLRTRFTGFQHRICLYSGPSASERVPASSFQSGPGQAPVLWVHGGEQGRAHSAVSEGWTSLCWF